MTANHDTAHHSRRTTYLVVGVLLVVLVAVGLITYRSAEATRAAEDKADQLTAALGSAGLRIPTRDQIVRVLGDDGGAVCADPNSALTRAVLAAGMVNGAAGPGIRPVITDQNVVRGELAVLSVYCPDKAAEFTTFVQNTKFGDVTKG